MFGTDRLITALSCRAEPPAPRLLPGVEDLGLDEFEVGDVSLIVAWKRGAGFAAGEVRVADAVAGHLRAACENTIERIGGREEREYGPDMQLEDEEYLVVEDDDLITDSAIAEVVLPVEPHDVISSQSLPGRPSTCMR